MEIWKTIKGYEGKYQVSNYGRVRSLDRMISNGTNSAMFHKGKILKPRLAKNGYMRVGLCGKDYYMHRLVSEVFIQNTNDLPQVNHKDEDKTNNKVSNLEWCDTQYNINYGTNRKRASEKLKGIMVNNKPILQLTKQGEILNKFISATEAASQTDIDNSSICKVANGKSKHAGGYSWRWCND